MTKRQQKDVVPFSAEDMFKLVADIDRYPEFVPYCTGLRVLKRKSLEQGREEILAQMLVQYKVFREQFKCIIKLDPNNNRINVCYVEGPIKKLDNIWHFKDLPNKKGQEQSEVDFQIDFEFKSFLLQKLSNAVFDKAFTFMSDAFVARAHQVYGDTKDNQAISSV